MLPTPSGEMVLELRPERNVLFSRTGALSLTLLTIKIMYLVMFPFFFLTPRKLRSKLVAHMFGKLQLANNVSLVLTFPVLCYNFLVPEFLFLNIFLFLKMYSHFFINYKLPQNLWVKSEVKCITNIKRALQLQHYFHGTVWSFEGNSFCGKETYNRIVMSMH